MEKDLCRGLYTSLFCVIIPTLFPYFLQFWYPYILLHFKCFLLLVQIFVKTLTGNTITLVSYSDVTIAHIKAVIEKEEGMSTDHQRLVHNDQQLQDDKLNLA